MKFMDFCAGIGGARLALENLGLECAGFSEIDARAERLYRRLFNSVEKNYGDLMKIEASALPDFDLLAAGFPCQTFSIAGQRKGLKDDRGQIIFGLLKIMKAKNPKYFILENVKGLLNHERGRTFKKVSNLLRGCGYEAAVKTMDSSHYGVPQKRERVYFIGIRKDLISRSIEFYEYFQSRPEKKKMKSLKEHLIDEGNEAFGKGREKLYRTFLNYLKNKYNKGRVSFSDLLKEELLIVDARQSDLRLYRGKAPTLRAGRHGLFYVRGGRLRRLSGYESLLLQGFPKRLAQRVRGWAPENEILSRSGNAMTVPVVSVCAESLIGFSAGAARKPRRPSAG